MHVCMKYRLNANGTIPSFLCLDRNGVGGVFGTPSPGTSTHNNILYVGIAENNATGDFEIIPTQQDLENYLVSICDGWVNPVDPLDPLGPTVPFDPVAAAQWVWERKIMLDAKEHG